MLSKRINRGTPDTVYAIVRNLHSATLVDGDVVQWLLSSDTPPTGYTRIPGVDVKQSASVANSVAGVMAKGSTLQGAYGLCQVYGYHSNVKTTAATLAVNTVVTADASGAAVAASVAALANITDRRIGTCITVGASNRAGIQLRVM
jgi:hypothetical protein